VTTALVDPMPMAEEKKTASVKLRIRVAELARFVAGDSPDQTITDLLSDILEPILEEKEQEIVARRMKPKGKGGSK
jgi:uncharacterized membrane-anchored protein